MMTDSLPNLDRSHLMTIQFPTGQHFYHRTCYGQQFKHFTFNKQLNVFLMFRVKLLCIIVSFTHLYSMLNAALVSFGGIYNYLPKQQAIFFLHYLDFIHV